MHPSTNDGAAARERRREDVEPKSIATAKKSAAARKSRTPANKARRAVDDKG